MPKRLFEDRQYDRLQHTDKEINLLRNRGFIPVVSSNVSAVGRDEGRLLIRFHGGATYVYPKSGDRFQDILSASSKGRFVWRELRRKRVPYYRTGSITIEEDVGDRDLMRTDIDTNVDISTLVDKDRAATVVSVSQGQARETVVDIVDRPRPTMPTLPTVDNANVLAALGLVPQAQAMSMALIASLVLASNINSRQA